MDINQEINELQNQITYHIISKALILAVKEGLAEHLSQSPISVKELAKRFGYDCVAAERFFKLLETLNLLKIDEENLVTQTELTPHLHKIYSEHYFGSFPAFNYFEDSLINNTECWSKAFGKPFYKYLQEHPHKSREFQNYLETTAKDWLNFIPQVFDFSAYRNIVDIGGGKGQLLNHILESPRCQKSKGVLFEKPEIIHEASTYISEKNLTERIFLKVGDFLADDLPDGDIYILCRVLLNWNDDNAIKIIKNCLKKAQKGQKIVIVDFVVPQKTHVHYQRALLHDINLLAVFGGRIRTTEEWSTLFAKSTDKTAKINIISEETYQNLNVPMILAVI